MLLLLLLESVARRTEFLVGVSLFGWLRPSAEELSATECLRTRPDTDKVLVCGVDGETGTEGALWDEELHIAGPGRNQAGPADENRRI